MAATGPVPFRLVLHRTAEGRSHGDLFVYVGGDRPLLTYEVTRDSLGRLCAGLGRRLPRHNDQRETAGSVPLLAGSTPLTHLQSEPLLLARHSGSVSEVVSHGTASPSPVRAARKGDHRALYWEYSGPIAGGRGRIRELIRGKLLGFETMADPPPVVALSWAAENPERT